MADAGVAPAFYASGRGGGLRAWWSVLHPPYTAWHLSYVAIGAALVHPLNTARLAETLLAFFLAVGVGAHALDELHGRPLRTEIPSWQLVGAAVLTVVGALVEGWLVGGLRLVPFMAVGAVLAFGYNLEWFGGILHGGVGFAAGWGAFPLLTGYYAQRWTLSGAVVVAAVGAFALSWAQRELSTPARLLRRRTHDARLVITDSAGTHEFGRAELLRPLERALKACTWSVMALAVALVWAARR